MYNFLLKARRSPVPLIWLTNHARCTPLRVWMILKRQFPIFPNMFWPKAARNTMGHDVSTWQSFVFSDNTATSPTQKAKFSQAHLQTQRERHLWNRRKGGLGKKVECVLCSCCWRSSNKARGFRNSDQGRIQQKAKPKAKRSMTTLYSLSTSSASRFLMCWELNSN